MSTIKINAITVPAESGDDLATRFAARNKEVDGTDGFEGFELLKPTDGRNTWLVVTQWRDEEAYQAWASGDAFTRAHGNRPAEDEAAEEGAPAQRPVGVSAELWSFQPVKFED